MLDRAVGMGVITFLRSVLIAKGPTLPPRNLDLKPVASLRGAYASWMQKCQGVDAALAARMVSRALGLAVHDLADQYLGRCGKRSSSSETRGQPRPRRLGAARFHINIQGRASISQARIPFEPEGSHSGGLPLSQFGLPAIPRQPDATGPPVRHSRSADTRSCRHLVW
jgi:hypothetical protein